MLCPHCKIDLVECVHGGDIAELATAEARPVPRVYVRREPARGVTASDRAATRAEARRLLEQLRTMGRCA